MKQQLLEIIGTKLHIVLVASTLVWVSLASAAAMNQHQHSTTHSGMTSLNSPQSQHLSATATGNAATANVATGVTSAKAQPSSTALQAPATTQVSSNTNDSSAAAPATSQSGSVSCTACSAQPGCNTTCTTTNPIHTPTASPTAAEPGCIVCGSDTAPTNPGYRSMGTMCPMYCIE